MIRNDTRKGNSLIPERYLMIDDKRLVENHVIE